MELHDQISSLRQKLASAACSPMEIPGVETAEISVFIALAKNGRGGGDYECELTPEDLAWITGLGVSISFALTCVPDAESRSIETPLIDDD